MIDLHCHLLPALDDGAPDLDTSLAMARLAAADGITVTACTPHILPGVHRNSGPQILKAVEDLALALAAHEIPLRVVAGADIHITPDLLKGLASGYLPTLNGSRYFLLEPPQHSAPPRFEDFVWSVVAAGFVPIITHPERLAWVEAHYSSFKRLATSGAWMQLTASSILGHFGRRVKRVSERMLDDGLVHIVASDGHNAGRRPPVMGAARAAIAMRLGDAEADRVVLSRPQVILKDLAANTVPGPQAVSQPVSDNFWRRVIARVS
jgi:protein-tyrosine phosphatase